MQISPAFGLGWHLWRRYRLFALAFLAYGCLLALGVPYAVRAHLQGVSLAATLPLVLALFITIALFANPEADIVGRNSGYPPYLLLLPVQTRALVFWPMFTCIATVDLAWLALQQLILHPLGVALPFWWPALILAALVACVQAVFWLPLGLAFLRLVLLVLLLPVVVLFGINAATALSPGLFAALYLSVIAVAYRVALTGVARARCGDTPEWLARPERHDTELRVQKPFVSAHQAQFRYEWSRNGILLPLLIGLLFLGLYGATLRSQTQVALDPYHPLIPSEQAVTGVSAIQVPSGVKVGLFLGLGMGPVLAMALGCGVWRPDNRKPDHSLNPFYAVRPLTSAALVLAKLKMAAASTLAAWSILLLFEALLLCRSAQDGITTAPLGVLLLHYVTLKSGLLALMVLAAAILSTWKGQVNGLWIDLAGRAWVANSYGCVVAGTQTLFLVFLTGISTQHPEAWPTLLRAVPYAVLSVTALKLLVAAWALNRCRRRNLIPARLLTQIAVGWLLAAFGASALLCLLLDSSLSDAGQIFCGVLLFLPLTRPALAPVALDWNRHR
jgi:hypothetical protein